MDDFEKQAEEYVIAFVETAFERYKDLPEKQKLQSVLADIQADVVDKYTQSQTLEVQVAQLNEFAELEEADEEG